jgi:hypothetical protein
MTIIGCGVSFFLWRCGSFLIIFSLKEALDKFFIGTDKQSDQKHDN